jgi:benzoyl-CoA reductase subunit D
VTRYLGIALEEVGALSCRASNPQMVSSICAVLAETDVINMVSRGISTPDILQGLHLSMAGRHTKLLRSISAQNPVAITGAWPQTWAWHRRSSRNRAKKAQRCAC